MHTVERQREQLEMAGISHFPAPELDWLDADIGRFALPARFALLIPGASPTRPAKRWPVQHFAAVAQRCRARGEAVWLLGAALSPIEGLGGLYNECLVAGAAAAEAARRRQALLRQGEPRARQPYARRFASWKYGH